MIRMFWIQAVKGAWHSYLSKMNKMVLPKNMDSYLSQKIDLGMTLEEFAEIVFIEGFVAGEKYSKELILGHGKCDLREN